MGSDHAPQFLIDAVLQLSEEISHSFVIIGSPKLSYLVSSPKVEFIPAEQEITMEDHPLHSIRKKKRASICIGTKLLKDKAIEAFVSAGNTGALLSSAKLYVSNIKGIKRPALLARMPTKRKPVTVLDVGANVYCKAEHLIQFAQLGAAYQKSWGEPYPRIGLLNIGTEAIKGTNELKKAYKELEKKSNGFHFLGNIEGKEVFEGNVDILITDGFTGNIFLKTAEGIANLVFDRLKENISTKEFKSLESHLKDFEKHLHYAEYPGALLCGVNGIIIKCHSYSTPQAFQNGILEAIRMLEYGLLEKIIEEMQSN